MEHREARQRSASPSVRLITKLIARVALLNRDRFAALDRCLMPDRLRVPPEIAALLLLEPTR